jgi:hypothetical protein
MITQMILISGSLAKNPESYNVANLPQFTTNAQTDSSVTNV